MSKLETTIEQLLAQADIKIGGTRPHDIAIHNPAVYGRVLKDQELGLGESYMDGWWDSPQLDECIARLLSADVASRMKLSPSVVACLASNMWLPCH